MNFHVVATRPTPGSISRPESLAPINRPCNAVGSEAA